MPKMSAPAIVHRATVVCEDYRVEGNGKLMLLGILARTVRIPQSPATQPLCLFQIFEAKRAGSFKITFEVTHVGDNAPAFRGTLDIQAGSAQAIVYTVAKVVGVDLSVGDYVVKTMAEDGTEIGSEPFSVVSEREENTSGS